MPLPIIGQLWYNGVDSVPFAATAFKYAPWIALIYVLRWFFAGTRNRHERVMHGKVVMVTGGTSGIGEALVRDLAFRGAQIILLVRSTSDSFLIDRINELREASGNHLIYAEECDLSSLHSIRLFATKFIDNSPPRRVDMIILCAGVMVPPLAPKGVTQDGVEEHWGVNYLANFQLLNILAPVLRIQPPDRDVRIIATTCTSYILGELDTTDTEFVRRGYPKIRPWAAYGAAKLALMIFLVELQRQLDSYKRPDGAPMNTRCWIVDPGSVRTPGMRRFLSLGSLWGLLLYLFMWPFWWLVLKGPDDAIQTYLTAAMSPDYATTAGGKLLKECKTVDYTKPEITNPDYAKALWQVTEAQIKDLEEKAAIERAKKKQQQEKHSKGKESKSKNARIEEIIDENEIKSAPKASASASGSGTPRAGTAQRLSALKSSK